MSGPGGWSATGVSFSDEIDLHFFRGNNGKLEESSFRTLPLDKKLSTIAASKNYQVLVLESIGSRAVGFKASEDFIRTVSTSLEIPPAFVSRILGPGSLSRFAHVLEFTHHEELAKPKQNLAAINMGFRWGAGHSNYMIVFGRFNIKTHSLRLFLGTCGLLDFPPPKTSGKEPPISEMARLAKKHWEHPMDLIALLLQRCEQHVDITAQKTNIDVFRLGKSLDSLYSPHLGNWSAQWSLTPDNDQQSPRTKTADLFQSYNSVTWAEKACNELTNICKQYQQLLTHLGKTHNNNNDTNTFIFPKSGLLDDITNRVEIHTHFYVYLEKIVSSLFTYQYNALAQNIAEAAQEDSASMKTVAYLTLAFLPATFVCALFSTSVLDLHNYHGSAGDAGVRVVSRGWWIFVLCCALATIATTGVWQVFRWRRCRRNAIFLRKVKDGV